MPDDRTTGRALVEDAVHVATAQASTDQARQCGETTGHLSAEPSDPLNRLVHDAARASQELADRATWGVQALIDLAEARPPAGSRWARN